MPEKRKLRDGAICPVCGEGHLKKIARPHTFTYNNDRHTIDNYEVFHCPVCEEDYLDHQTIQKFEPQLKEHRRRVDGFLTPSEIKAIRQQFEVSQQLFSEILGGGTKGFARYESESVIQSQAMDNLLRVLAAYPEAFSYLRQLRERKPQPPKRRRTSVHVAMAVRHQPKKRKV